MKTVVAGLYRCTCHYTGLRVVEEDAVDAEVAKLRANKEVTCIFVGDRFIEGAEHLTASAVTDWKDHFRKALARAVAESLDKQSGG